MLEEIVRKTIQEEKLIEDGDSIVVGVSGGPDSITLLNILVELQKEIKFSLQVAHINHGIRIEAEDDQKYVEEYCEKRNIPCFVKKVNINEIASVQKIGTEEAGRTIRYNFFQEILEKTKSNKIATAHTKNDNVETIFMNLIRGCGIAGLKGINVIRQSQYIRPLLHCERKEIEEYCEKKKLNPRIDKTNFENIYTRNKIRNQFIPYIQKEFNPNIIETIDRLSKIVREENQYLEEKTKQAYQEILIQESKEQVILDLKKFNALEIVIKNRIVLYTINRLFGSSSGIEKIHIQDIIKLCNNNIGNKYLIPNKKVKILLKNRKIYFIPNQ